MKHRILAIILCIAMLLSSTVISGTAAEKKYPESSHPYANDMDEVGEYFVYDESGEMKIDALKITFSEDTETETMFDFITVFGGDGIIVGMYTGKELAGKSIISPLGSFGIFLTTDSLNTAYGYKIVNVEPLYAVNYSFETNGGSPIDTINSVTVDKSPRTSKEGFYFAGWYDNKELSGEQVSFPYNREKDTTLYAAWTDVPSTNIADFKYTASADGIMINEYTGADTTVFVPDEIGGTPVTSIDASAFAGTPVEKIVIGENLTTVDVYSFDSCLNLTAITISEKNKSFATYNGSLYSNDMTELIRVPCGTVGSFTVPNTVVKIANGAFNNCTKLTETVLPDTLAEIPDKTFNYCSGLTSVVIPATVTRIGSRAFYACAKLSDIKISDSVSSIGADAFKNTAFYKNTDNWENGILYLEKYAVASNKSDVPAQLKIKNGTLCLADSIFSANSAITSVTLPDSLKYIGNKSFESCTETEKIVLPDNLRGIAARAFTKCTKLSEITVPDSVRTIGNNAFEGCTALTSAAIGKGVSEISASLFASCTSLKTVTVPSTVKTVGKAAFKNCSALADIQFKGSEKDFEKIAVAADNTYFTTAKVTYVEAKWAKGDVNHDNKATAADSAMLKAIILGKKIPNENELYAADLNSDGKVTAADGQKMIQILIGRTPFTPAN